MHLNEADTRAKLIDPKLYAAGWGEDRIRREHYVLQNHEFTAGRIYLVGDEPRRRGKDKADYLLRYSDVIPIAIVEAKKEGLEPEVGIQKAKDYAEAMDVPFTYSSNGHRILEFDFLTNSQRELEDFPSPENLWERFTTYHSALMRGGTSPILHPYCPASQCGKASWYFQEAAVNRVLRHIMQGDKRLLLAMATGTGKTFVAFQIIWKLIKSGWLRRVLFITDRNFLRDNAYNAFGPFEDARHIIKEGEVNLHRDIYFGTYQSLWSGEDGNRLFERYRPDFFDLIIIDECHRSGFGTWNEILSHFPNAIQMGMTATPKRTDNIDTYDYFCRENDDKPIYEYSFGRGIDDGFLATYRVHRVRTTVDRDGLNIEDAQTHGAEIYVPEEAELRSVYHTPQFEREITLPDRTEAMCEHLAHLLSTFGPLQKTMVFCVSMDHAAKVAGELQNHFAHLGIPNYAVRIVSEEPAAKDRFEQFQDSSKTTPVVATTADLLTTGVDVPSVRNIVFMKTVGSPHVFKQIVGRGSRIDSATGKLWFRIIDYTNATRLFDEWDRPPGKPPPVYEGPRTASLTGFVANAENEAPIPEALVTVLLGPHEQVQQRTNAEGEFAFDGLPEGLLRVIAAANEYRQNKITVQTVANTVQTAYIELRPAKGPVGKIRVKGLEVLIADEAIFTIESTGKQLTLEEYKDYARMEVLKQNPTLQTLRDVWVNPSTRGKFLDALEQASVYVEVLADVLGRSNGDQFDILAHVAFDTPIRTRDERAEAFGYREQDFISRYSEEAREVILHLLDKYRLGGVEEISNPEVFRISPFDEMGQAPGVVERFGDTAALRSTLVEMQLRLYPAEESP